MKEKLDCIVWSGIFMVCALFFSVQVPPYIGIFVFVVFFTLSVAMIKKLIDLIRKGD